VPQDRQGQLAEVVAAGGAAGGLAGSLHGRQEQADQGSHDGDHHEQFHETEAAPTAHDDAPTRRRPVAADFDLSKLFF
jgi:hypothetical protein